VKAALALVIAVTACSDGGTKPKPDAPPDVMFMGEYVDWDSTNNTFCGINKATFTVRGDATRTDPTNPNGRFMLTIAGVGTSLVDITPPTTGSECLAGMPTYSMPGILVADLSVIATMEVISARDFTTTRAGSLGVTLDSAKGHVFVHVDKTQAAVAISAASDAAQKFDGTAWGAGTTGVNVFFPNVAPATVMVTMGTATGNGMVPVEAGKITYVTLVGS
jgi:hypothetical protein